MPKNSTATILRRWKEMDSLLQRSELIVPKFAKKWGVSQKTVRRDLDGFRELGQVIRELVPNEGERSYRWGYASGVRPLFQHPELAAKPATRPGPPGG